jgi:hypothetical protein
MPRIAKPYKERAWYITRAGGEFRRLCPVSDGLAKARALLREHLKQLEQQRERNGGRTLPRLTVSELFVMFLQAVEAEKSAYTFADYQRWCVEFARRHGKRPARDISRLDAQQFKQHLLTATWVRNKQPPRPYKPKTANSCRRAATRSPGSNCCPARGGGGSPPRRSSRPCCGTAATTTSATC